MREMNGAPWWRRLVAALAPPPPVDVAERLAGDYAAEVRLAHDLAEDAETLSRYPQPRAAVLKAAGRAGERGRRLRQALEDLGHPVIEPGPGSGLRATLVGERLRARVGELGTMRDAYLTGAYAVEREHPDIATLLHDHQRAVEGDRRDLIWTLARLAETAVNPTSPEAVAA
jgi:hypothetical protein